MDVREKLVEMQSIITCPNAICNFCEHFKNKSACERHKKEVIADNMIDHGVTVQKHGYLETVVEVKDNTACGNGVKIEYKRCSCCKNPTKFFEDDFCGNCGAKLDLPQPPKGE